MEPPPVNSNQMMQRLRVGVTGLALVVLLILVASAVYRSANKEAPPNVVGAPKPGTLANMTGPVDGNQTAADGSDDDPLAALGVAPGPKAAPTPTPTPTPVATNPAAPAANAAAPAPGN